ncbi:MAG TPA: extracellular solute-binding protein [Alphaproteobacteria bacterium]|nr:extracellular solute-binding protein [Alphaproteobacteria bacterium]
MRLAALALALTFAPAALAQTAAQKTTVSHAFAIHGDVRYPADFKHYDYVNPAAPKGGDVKFAAVGNTYDSLNGFILRGVPAAGSTSIYDALMVRGAQEPSTSYCLICETIEIPEDRSWALFTLRPQARWHDGRPITPEDVIWTLETLKTKGHPRFRTYYANVAKAEKVGERKVKFTFSGGENRELPGIIGELPILPKHYWEGKDFEKTTLEPPLGSSAYKIDSFEAGRFITLRRVPDYWGANLPVNVGLNNFDTIRYDYYRDQTVSLEAFKAGQYDIRAENSAKNWATAYDIPAVANGLIKREEIPDEDDRVMQGWVFNTRRPIFQDRRVREAIIHAFDFEWTNKNLFYGYYKRIDSYFGRDELSARGLPKGEELRVLEQFRDKLPPEVFTKEYAPPKTDGTGNWRENQRIATRLLREAGWRVVDQKLVDAQGKQMSFEILLDNPQFERITLPFVENLKRLGIDARIRTVDTAQSQRREDEFDFDMSLWLVAQSESPGNEQRDYWSSAAADTNGTRNLPGIKDPVVDALIELIIQAPDRETLVARTHALDRVLLWGHYVVPHFRLYARWVAYWDRFSHPPVDPKVGFAPGAWWVDPQKDAALRQKRGQ